MENIAVYGGLFVTAFVAATILPAQSEAALGALLAMDAYSPVLLVLVASLGNVLGSVVNWSLGRGIGSWAPEENATLRRAMDWYRRYGRWSLLLSWLPVVGDPLTLAAGILGEPLWRFLILVAIAKTTRYLAIAAAVHVWMA